MIAPNTSVASAMFLCLGFLLGSSVAASSDLGLLLAPMVSSLEDSQSRGDETSIRTDNFSGLLSADQVGLDVETTDSTRQPSAKPSPDVEAMIYQAHDISSTSTQEAQEAQVRKSRAALLCSIFESYTSLFPGQVRKEGKRMPRPTNGRRFIRHANPFSHKRGCLALWNDTTSAAAVTDLFQFEYPRRWDTPQGVLLSNRLLYRCGQCEDAQRSDVFNLSRVLSHYNLIAVVPQPSSPPAVKKKFKVTMIMLFDLHSAVVRGTPIPQREAAEEKEVVEKQLTPLLSDPIFRQVFPSTMWRAPLLRPFGYELPAMVEKYVVWANDQIDLLDEEPEKAVAVACDIHSAFFHLHPFIDGNARVAWILSSLVLQSVGLPPVFIGNDKESDPWELLMLEPSPEFTWFEGTKYEQAVYKALSPETQSYSDLCDMYVAGARRTQLVIKNIAERV